MAEYIEREAVLQKVKKLQETDPATIGKKQFADGYFTGLDELEVIFRGIPAAEAEPVVRCKNCKHCEYTRPCAGLPFYTCLRRLSATEPDDFCSYGERREGE